jgi:hypothetical protein
VVLAAPNGRVQQEAIGGRSVAGEWQFRCTCPRSGPTSAQ